MEAPDDEPRGDADLAPIDLGHETEEDRLERKRLDEQSRLETIRNEHDAEDESLGRQRRQNVRVEVQLPIVVRLSGRESSTRTRDLSATGVGFSTRLPVELDQRCEVTVEFADWAFTKAVVVKFVKPILAGCVVGAQFDELTEDERERLVKQVFDVQRTQLNEGRAKAR